MGPAKGKRKVRLGGRRSEDNGIEVRKTSHPGCPARGPQVTNLLTRLARIRRVTHPHVTLQAIWCAISAASACANGPVSAFGLSRTRPGMLRVPRISRPVINVFWEGGGVLRLSCEQDGGRHRSRCRLFLTPLLPVGKFVVNWSREQCQTPFIPPHSRRSVGSMRLRPKNARKSNGARFLTRGPKKN